MLGIAAPFTAASLDTPGALSTPLPLMQAADRLETPIKAYEHVVRTFYARLVAPGELHLVLIPVGPNAVWFYGHEAPPAPTVSFRRS